MLILLIHSDVSSRQAFRGFLSELLPVGTLCFEAASRGHGPGTSSWITPTPELRFQVSCAPGSAGLGVSFLSFSP